MKKLLLMLTVATMPLCALDERESPWEDLYDEQVSDIHDLVWEFYCTGNTDEANRFLFILYALINKKLPCCISGICDLDD